MRFTTVMVLCVLCTLLFPHYLNASDVGLPAETLIRLRLPSPVRFSNTKIGDSVQLEVAEDVKVGDLTVIRRGTPVRATITTSFKSVAIHG